MTDPWDSGGSAHNIRQRSDDIVECTECGKMATSEKKLSKTRCNTDPDRREGGYDR